MKVHVETLYPALFAMLKTPNGSEEIAQQLVPIIALLLSLFPKLQQKVSQRFERQKRTWY